MYLHRASWHSSATLTEGFPCFFLSCKANARVKPAKMGHGPLSSKIFVFFYVLFVLCRSVYFVCVCKYVLYYCHQVATQLQLTNTSYHIMSYGGRLWTCLCIRHVARVWVFDVISGKFNVERIEGQYLNYEVFSKKINQLR